MIPIAYRGFARIHPFVPIDQVKGYLELSEDLNKMLSDLDGQIIRRMQDEGMSQARDSLNTATFYLNEDIVPQIEDWNIFYKYIKDNDYFHILHKRVSVKAYRELIENGEEVHGTTPKQLTTLRMRSNNS